MKKHHVYMIIAGLAIAGVAIWAYKSYKERGMRLQYSQKESVESKSEPEPEKLTESLEAGMAKAFQNVSI